VSFAYDFSIIYTYHQKITKGVMIVQSRDQGLDYLLGLNGDVLYIEKGLWFKFEVFKVDVTAERPHGISYCFTLHDKYNKRIFGMDNAHAVKSSGKHKGRISEYDHMHKNEHDKGTPYEFVTAGQLVADFYEHIYRIIDAYIAKI